MPLTFERGDEDRPKGHAIIYWRHLHQPRFLSVYIVVHPIELSTSQLEEAANIMGINYSPDKIARLEELRREGKPQSHILVLFPCSVADVEELRRRAAQRDDDLINAGSIDSFSNEREEIVSARDEYHQLYTKMLAKEIIQEGEEIVEEVEGWLKQQQNDAGSAG